MSGQYYWHPTVCVQCGKEGGWITSWSNNIYTKLWRNRICSTKCCKDFRIFREGGGTYQQPSQHCDALKEGDPLRPIIIGEDILACWNPDKERFLPVYIQQ
jgi:hypothetical protein